MGNSLATFLRWVLCAGGPDQSLVLREDFSEAGDSKGKGCKTAKIRTPTLSSPHPPPVIPPSPHTPGVLSQRVVERLLAPYPWQAVGGGPGQEDSPSEEKQV